MVIWFVAPTQKEKAYFTRAWKSRIGDETELVEHALMLEETA
jgi:hypothetical protein